MKKRISIILAILLLLVSVLGTFCYATEIQPRVTIEDGEDSSDTDFIDNEDEIINPISLTDSEENDPIITTTTPTEDYDITYDDLYAFENQDYEMSGLIDGNAFIIVNGDVKFSGAVNGSAFIIANGTVEFTEDSSVYDALYVIAPEVKINGAVYDVYALAQKFEIMENGYISRDIRVLASDAILRGTIYRDVYLTAENIDVKDDETALLLGGNFNYTSKKEAEGLDEVVLYGEIKFDLQETTERTVSIGDKIIQYASQAVTSIIYVLVVYFLLILIAPKFVERVGKDLKEKTIFPFLIGLVSWIVLTIAIVISFMLLFTSFGSAITIIAWFMMFIIIYISSAVFSISVLDIVKTKVAQIKDNKALEICALIVIALVVWILQQIPYVGGLVSFVVLTTGIGLIVRNIIAKKETNNKTTEETVE